MLQIHREGDHLLCVLRHGQFALVACILYVDSVKKRVKAKNGPITSIDVCSKIRMEHEDFE